MKKTPIDVLKELFPDDHPAMKNAPPKAPPIDIEMALLLAAIPDAEFDALLDSDTLPTDEELCEIGRKYRQ